LDIGHNQTEARGLNGPRQSRTSERHLSLFRVGALRVGDRRELCVIRNISAEGLQMRVYSEVAVDAKVSIELKQSDPISATVVWSKDGSAGVKFDKPINVEAVLAHAPNERRPRMPRIEIDQPVILREGARTYRGRVFDISQGGVRVECDAVLPINGDVVVTLPGLSPEAATARWRDGRQYGLGFNSVLTVGQLVHWLQEHSRSATGTSG
jgi:hypothetical protein